MDKIINMSLDEYIASHQKAAKETTKSADSTSNSSSNESKFKAERRQHEANDCEDDTQKDDLEEVEDSETKTMGIWRGPTASTNFLDLDYMNNDFNEMFNNPDLKPQCRGSGGDMCTSRRFDLRERIQRSGSSNTPIMLNLEPQQKRPMNTNVIALRSEGVGPLIPSIGAFDGRQNQNRQNRWQHHNKRQRNRGNGGGGGNGNWSNQRNAGSNNGRIQRFNQYHNNHDIFNKNIKSLMFRQNRINNSNYNMSLASDTGSVRDLTIECPTDYINLSPNSQPKIYPDASLHLKDCGSSGSNGNLQINSRTVGAEESQQNNNNGLKALLGINDNFKTEMMPMLASKFLDFLQNGPNQTVHKPMYDMKIQKEIHEIQKKPLMYKCPGGEVISSDGTGINNCEIIPRSSGVTLNYRFG